VPEFWTTSQFLGLLQPSKLYVHLPLGHVTSALAARWRHVIEELKIARANGARDQEAQKANLLAKYGIEVKFGDNGNTAVLFKSETKTEVDESQNIEAMIKMRAAARSAKDWAESDRIRDELAAMGIAVKDSKDGTTTWEVAR
jgi:cysteinyl-tRNA synthetase